VAIHDVHFDGDTYPDPTTFDGFRFLKLKRQAVGNERHFDMITTSAESLGLGSGAHACLRRGNEALARSCGLISSLKMPVSFGH